VQAKRAFSDGLEWGAVAGVYEGFQIAIERVRERRDWVSCLFYLFVLPKCK
jgi:hypothetical protein